MKHNLNCTIEEMNEAAEFSKALREISLTLATWATFEFCDGCSLPEIKDRLFRAAMVAAEFQEKEPAS